MVKIKDDVYYVEKITKDLSFIVEHTKDLTKEQLTKDEVLQDSIMFRLVQVAETRINSRRILK